MPPDRCCRCHAILTSEEKQYFGYSCNECENDLRYEEWEQPVKSAYWRWRAICYCLRFLRYYPGRLTGLLLHRLRGNADAWSKLPFIRR